MKILIVDDEHNPLDVLGATLKGLGHEAIASNNPYEALAVPKLNSFDVAIVDQKMPGMDGFELGKDLLDRMPGLVLIMLTAYGSIDKAVQAMR
ncbi:MAG: two component system response regulator, sigma54-specific, partial [Bacteroidetes bacterium]|nr:two component system response regulator, sigma54-specific [Bacteroidota bacterium]